MRKSGFIYRALTLYPQFENMLGFTQSEVSLLLDEVYQDYEIEPSTRKEVEQIMKNQYNGYHFVKQDGEALYNPTILLYFLQYFTHNREIPEILTDMNLKTDLLWIRRITGANPQNTEEFVTKLTTDNIIEYDRSLLTTKFNTFQFFEKGFYPVSFFYLGMLTIHDKFYLKLPNLNMRQIFVEYFNEIHNIDVSTKYAQMMQDFINKPDIPKLFSDYWQLYVSQLPEALFQKVNENFYRTTFFELCSRYLSPWFTWNIERSYPKGRSDLEFVGKYSGKYAGIRIVIEFKYFSNSKLKKMNTTIKKFSLRKEDTAQILKYVEGLKAEYPEAITSQFVIYCFGNQGFRVFEI
ncbi:MAG: PD-(D/E)XK nuclease domain-containing protein [Desulfamplus sp.]|nr:PD-(D/E)XK nuclease domain-containing protein [Desulfamplus sp.]